MAPIHDSDIAAERWSKAEWNHYELWERIEIRLRRRKWLWISGATAIFLILSSIPILIDRWPKWTALSATRNLGQQVNILKRLAATEHQAFRIVFKDGLNFQIEKSASCELTGGAIVSSGTLLRGPQADRFTLVSPELGTKLGIPGLVTSFCYDSIQGNTSQDLLGFAVIPVKDLTPEPKLDRMSVILLKGHSAEISFD